MPKISIVVPTYNYGNMIHRCLKSLINQTLKDIEIIIVDDFSTDHTEEVIQFYQKDSRVRYIKNPSNMGPLVSRNKGMQLASGEYIAFCDADDTYEQNAMELLYNKGLQVQADIVRCTFRAIPSKKILLFTSKEDWVSSSLLKEYLLNVDAGTTCGYLFSRRIVKKYLDIAPDAYVVNGEDLLMTALLHYYAEASVFIDIPLYRYHFYPRPQSSAQQREKALKQFYDYVLINELMENFLKKHGIYKEYVHYWAVQMKKMVFLSYTTLMFADPENFPEFWDQNAPPIFKKYSLYSIVENRNCFVSVGIIGSFKNLFQAVLARFRP